MTKKNNAKTAAIRGVLFDLDGTLLDTAPDMVGALNALRAEERLGPVPYAIARAHVSTGAIGLLKLAFPTHADQDMHRLHQRYLQIYADRLSTETLPFPGIEELLVSLERSKLIWGVVTNKPASLTEPLLEALKLLHRCACVVSGDTLLERKPHPKPLLHALAQAGIDSNTAIYIGDASRDIEAGKAAGVTTVAVTYGYILPGDEPSDWGADMVIAHPDELLEYLLNGSR
ncbi:MAG: HAD-IA family hydrolase [Pseudomonadota bacterium]|nr:HAD-IA family hydrolase [Pseudomonadota bacterium]